MSLRSLKRRSNLAKVILWAAIPLWFNGSASAQEKGRPTLVVQNGHASDVNVIAYSVDERLLASASDDGAIKLWATDSGILLRTLNAGASVHNLSISPDGLSLAASTNREIKFWTIETGELTRTLAVASFMHGSLAFSNDWSLFAAGQADGSVGIFTAATGVQIRRLKAGNYLTSIHVVAFSPDGKILATNSDENTIKLWDVASGKEIHTLSGHGDQVNCLAFSPDGLRLASGSGSSLARKENSVRLWDVTSGMLLSTLAGTPVAKNALNYPEVLNVSFSPDGKQLLTHGQDAALKLWDVASGKLVRVVKDKFFANSVAISPSWSTFASFSFGDYAIEVWETQTGSLRRRFFGQVQSIGMLKFSPDGTHVGVTVGADDIYQSVGYLWEFQAGPLSSQPLYFKGSPHLVFKPEGLGSVSIDNRGKITLGRPARNRTSGYLEETINNDAPDIFPGNSALSDDGQSLAITNNTDHTINLWDLRQKKLTHTIPGHGTVISALLFTADGQRLISAGWDRTIKVSDARTGKLIRTLAGHTSIVTALALSPDGKTIASGSADYLVDRDHSIKLWNLQSGQVVRTLEGHANGVELLAISADGKTLASAGRAGEIKLWDMASGNLLSTIAPSGTATTAITFHPRGRFLVTGSADGTIKILSATNLTLVATVVAFSDGNWLITSPTGLFDGSAAAWDRILWRFSAALRDIAPVEVFFNEFYYPDLLTDLLAGRDPKPVQDITERDRHQPQVRIALSGGNAPATEFAERNVNLQVEVTDSPAGAQDVRLFRNGSLVKTWRGDVLQGQQKATLEVSVPIVEGENRFTAYAFNHDNVKSADAILTIKGAASLKREGIAYVLVVGIDEYVNPDYKLSYAVADAKAFGSELKQRLPFTRVEVVPLYNSEATKANILLALALFGNSAADGQPAQLPATAPESLKLIRKAQPEDVVIVYFAGHGTARENQFYLIPHDLGYERSQQVASGEVLQLVLRHSISDRDLEGALTNVDAKHLLLVIDACNSGQALDAEEKRRGPMNSKGLAQLAYEKGMFILTAAQSYQAAQEVSELGHGLLTFVLVEEGLKGMKADQDKNRELTEREWLDYATARVPEKQIEQMKRRALEIKDNPSALKKRGTQLIFTEGDNATVAPENRSVQRPRVFYRRETVTNPLIVATSDPLAP